MKLSQGTKVFIGIITWLVVLVNLLVLAFVVCSMVDLVNTGPPSGLFVGLFPALALVVPVTTLAGLGLLVFYLVYLVKTRRLRTAKKWVWGIVLLAGPMLMPLFFHYYVWPTREQFLKRLEKGRSSG